MGDYSTCLFLICDRFESLFSNYASTKITINKVIVRIDDSCYWPKIKIKRSVVNLSSRIHDSSRTKSNPSTERWERWRKFRIGTISLMPIIYVSIIRYQDWHRFPSTNAYHDILRPFQSCTLHLQELPSNSEKIVGKRETTRSGSSFPFFTIQV